MSFCERAIAYLRVALPDDDPSEALELAEDDSPVLEELARAADVPPGSGW